MRTPALFQCLHQRITRQVALRAVSKLGNFTSGTDVERQDSREILPNVSFRDAQDLLLPASRLTTTLPTRSFVKWLDTSDMNKWLSEQLTSYAPFGLGDQPRHLRQSPWQ